MLLLISMPTFNWMDNRCRSSHWMACRSRTMTRAAVSAMSLIFLSHLQDVSKRSWPARLLARTQHWRVLNPTHELHPFHIHQVHFLAYATNGVRSTSADWLDTVDVPYGGSVDLVMDFTDPVIRGMSVFHCHLLSHEDKGMMAKILFE